MDTLERAFNMSWVRVATVRDEKDVSALSTSLDLGESEAIVLMREERADLLLVDGRRARIEAVRRGLPIAGTIGLLQMAKRRGLIAAVAPLLRDLQRSGFWVSEDLVHQVRRGEM